MHFVLELIELRNCNIYVLCITDLSVSGPKLTLVDEIIIIGIAGEIVY